MMKEDLHKRIGELLELASKSECYISVLSDGGRLLAVLDLHTEPDTKEIVKELNEVFDLLAKVR